MRRAAIALVSTVAGLVMLLTLKANTTQPTTTAAVAEAPPAAVAATPSAGGPPASKAPATGASPPTDDAAAAPQTGTGTLVRNQYESFQVQVTVTGDTITKVEVIALTTKDAKSKRIAGSSLPRLQQATLEANSADVDTVSGATYTSESYRESLQSALDQAGR